MKKMIEIGENIGQFFAHGWGLVLLAIATIIGGIAAIDYFCSECLKNRFKVIFLCDGCLRNRFAKILGNPKFSPLQIVLLYKHEVELDESAVSTLETLLITAGHQVFIDRDKNFEQLQRELKRADAVVILLTSASVLSDMFCYEVETAYRIVKDQKSRKPHLIPLRVQFADPLPEQNLANLLEHLPPIDWRDITDSSRLMPELLRRLAKAPAEMPYGAMPVNSLFYVKRQVDQELQRAIVGNNPIILLRGPRQVGKTSLLARSLQTARNDGKQVWLTDFQALGEATFQTAEKFYYLIAQELTAQAQVKLSVDRYWNSKLTVESAFDDYLCNHLLPKINQPVLLWAIDEADRLLQQPFCGSVFGKFRGWFNEREIRPERDILRTKLQLIIVYATEYHLFIKDPAQSPFNVGHKLTLENFTLAQVADLNQRYDSWLTPEELSNFYNLVGGHPYLTRFGLHTMRNNRLTFTEFTRSASLEQGPFGDHLRRIVTLLDRDPDLRDALRKVIQGQSCPEEAAFDRLRSGGILKGDSRKNAQLQCKLYTDYLTQRL